MSDQAADNGPELESVEVAAPTTTMRSLSHGLDVLSVLTRAGRPVGLSEVAEQVGLHRSTVHRILSTFVEYGLVRRDEERAYSVGLTAIELARAAGYPSIVDDPISQEITALHLTTRARAVYAIPRFGRMSCVVASERGEVSFPIVSQHALLPLHSTAAGKAYLAFRPESEVARVLDEAPFPATTPYTATSAVDLQRALNRARGQGFATEAREFSLHGRAIAVPVFDRGGLAVASVAVGLPDAARTSDGVDGIVESAGRAAERISQSLFGPSTG